MAMLAPSASIRAASCSASKMRRVGWSSHESSVRSANSPSRSRPGPRTAAVTKALGRASGMRSDPPGRWRAMPEGSTRPPASPGSILSGQGRGTGGQDEHRGTCRWGRAQTVDRARRGTCTVGVDIGTTSVKAVAVDARGEVVARTRVPHRWALPPSTTSSTTPPRPGAADPGGPSPRSRPPSDGPAAGVVTTAMVPSITAVDRRGIPRLPGLLYGDDRARSDRWDGDPVARRDDHGGEREEGARMLAWAAATTARGVGLLAEPGRGHPRPVRGARHRLGGGHHVRLPRPERPLGPGWRWPPSASTRARSPGSSRSGRAAGTVRGTPTAVGGGSIDAFCEQIVAGADEPGDVLVIFGATLIVWVVVRRVARACRDSPRSPRRRRDGS